MRKTPIVIFMAVISWLMVAVPLAAHHGSAGYDLEKELTMKGTVTEWLWANPHCFLKYATTDHKRVVLHRDQLTITVRPAKNGLPVGQLMKVILPNGKELIGWNPAVR